LQLGAARGGAAGETGCLARALQTACLAVFSTRSAWTSGHFSAQLRVAILLLVIGVTPSAGELTADDTQLPAVFQGTDLF
jgi:hypothetical protein